MKLVDVQAWRNRLLRQLDNGVFDLMAWKRFVAMCYAYGFDSNAEAMKKRMAHYTTVTAPTRCDN